MVIIRKKKTNQAFYKKTWFFLLIALLFASPYIKSELHKRLPIFSTSQARSFLLKHYPRMMVRYTQSDSKFNAWLPLARKAVRETVLSNTVNALNNDSLPRININIDFESFQNIKAERNSMLGKVFMAPSKTYYKGSIQYNGDRIPIKLRLKGERTDHIREAKKWSFRIKTRKGKSIFGLKEFSIQHPKTRSYQLEPLYHYMAKQLGFLALKFFYVDVSINGESIGIMALEEHFAKELLEGNERKEGHIIQLDDKNVQKLYHAALESLIKDDPRNEKKISRRSPKWMFKKPDYSRIHRVYYNALNAQIRSYTDENPALDSQKEVAIGLLKAVMAGKLNASQVFDAQAYGKLCAYLTLWGSAHNISFRNARYYFNPYTFTFEPIAFDSNAYTTRVSPFEEIPFDTKVRDHELNRIIFSDPVILKSYKKWLGIIYRYVSRKEFFEDIRRQEQVYLNHLRREFLFLPEMDFTKFIKDIKKAYDNIPKDTYFIKRVETKNTPQDKKPLSIPRNFILPEIVQGNIVFENEKAYLELHNLFPLSTNITSFDVMINDEQRSNVVDTALPITLEPFYYNEHRRDIRIPLKNIKKDDEITMTGYASIETQEQKTYVFTIGRSYPLLEKHPLDSQSVDSVRRHFPRIQYSKATDTFTIAKGSHTISNRVIFPQGAALNIEAGATIKFSENASILLKGALHAKGTKEAPIIFTALNKEKYWSGFTVMQSKVPSMLEHVIFEKTNFTKDNQWQLTGGVSFYRSDVTLKHVSFNDTIAEDALNIIHSKFIMENCSVTKTRSDAFDGDFVEGLIKNSSFSHVGGDGIDFSGSKISAIELTFSHIHDKAVSVGEATKLEGSNLQVSKTGTGFAVKDGSIATVKNSEFHDIEYATLMAYNKKHVYGPSKLFAKDIVYKQGEKALMAQIGSSLEIDGRNITPIKIDIEKLYSEGYMRK